MRTKEFLEKVKMAKNVVREYLQTLKVEEE